MLSASISIFLGGNKLFPTINRLIIFKLRKFEVIEMTKCTSIQYLPPQEMQGGMHTIS